MDLYEATHLVQSQNLRLRLVSRHMAGLVDYPIMGSASQPQRLAPDVDESTSSGKHDRVRSRDSCDDSGINLYQLQNRRATALALGQRR